MVDRGREAGMGTVGMVRVLLPGRRALRAGALMVVGAMAATGLAVVAALGSVGAVGTFGPAQHVLADNGVIHMDNGVIHMQ
jgi:hypothetical protein